MPKFRQGYRNQSWLVPIQIENDIPKDSPVRILDEIINNLDISNIEKLYKPNGRHAYEPRMMLKIIIYGYMNCIYSCRKIEAAVHRDIHFIWLANFERPDFITINRFRNLAKDEIETIFKHLVTFLVARGFLTLEEEYVDGTKIESRANKYTFIWRKSVERNRERLLKKIDALLSQINEVVAQEDSIDNEHIEVTPERLKDISDALNQAIASSPAPQTKEEKKAQAEKKKKIVELEKCSEKLREYDDTLEKIGTRNSMSKTDPDATMMRMKEDIGKNGQPKPGFNLQISTVNQYITSYALYPNPGDPLTFIPFMKQFAEMYGLYPSAVVADSAYGTEENYHYMELYKIEAFVKYVGFDREQRPRYKPEPFDVKGLFYNQQEDYFVCPMGQHLKLVETKVHKTVNDYPTISSYYKAQKCQGCPLRGLCHKGAGERVISVNFTLNKYREEARKLLTSEKGIEHRRRRQIEPEAVFGQIKEDMHYRRFRHFGKDKVTMDFSFLAIAFNIKKLCSTLKKQGGLGKNPPVGASFSRVLRYIYVLLSIFLPSFFLVFRRRFVALFW